MIYDIFEARNRLSRLIRLAIAGETVLIANRGKPVARLVPADEPAGDPADTAHVSPARPGALVDWLDTNPLPPHLRRPGAEIDADIESQRRSWD